jgi:hypothetical protein
VHGFQDRKEAAVEALNHLRSETEYDGKVDADTIKRRCGSRRLRPLPKNVAEEFFAWANFVIEETFSLEETSRTIQENRKKKKSMRDARRFPGR